MRRIARACVHLRNLPLLVFPSESEKHRPRRAVFLLRYLTSSDTGLVHNSIVDRRKTSPTLHVLPSLSCSPPMAPLKIAETCPGSILARFWRTPHAHSQRLAKSSLCGYATHVQCPSSLSPLYVIILRSLASGVHYSKHFIPSTL